MKKEKYYYSKGYRKALIDVIVDETDHIVHHGAKYGVFSLPRVTICGIYDDEAHTMSYGVARCSSRDEFKREFGQRISYGRAVKRPYRVIQIQPTDKISEVFIANAKAIEEEVLGQQVPKFDE